MRDDNRNPVANNRIAGSNAPNAGTQLTNADIQRRNVLWAREAGALKSGDMAVERVRLNLIEELLGYIRSRANLPAAKYHVYTARDGKQYSTHIEYDGSHCSYENAHDRSIKLAHVMSNAPYVIGICFVDVNLTRARVDRIATAIRALNTVEFARQCQTANPCVENGVLFQQMATTLNETLRDVRQQHAQYSGRHHVHISGSRFPFFGSGSLFQSKAENTVLSAIAELERVIQERTRLRNSHVEHSNEYNTFVTAFRL